MYRKQIDYNSAKFEDLRGQVAVSTPATPMRACVGVSPMPDKRSNDGAALTVRLEGWKAIAAYLGREVRTVQRWEREQKLPVHRLIHNSTGTVYADTGELDAWWARRSPSEAATTSTRRLFTVAVLLSQDATHKRFNRLSHTVLHRVVAALRQIPLLRVAPLPTCNDGDAGATAAAVRQCRPDVVLRGRVGADRRRLIGELQLLSPSGDSLWMGRVEANHEDAPLFRERIAHTAVNGLTITILANPNACSDDFTDPDARTLHLIPRHHFQSRTLDGLRKSIALEQAAIRRDARFAAAHAALALSYVTLASYNPQPPAELIAPAKRAAREALGLDDRQSDAFAALGYAALCFDWDWTAARDALERSTQLNPRNATAYQWLALLNLVRGDAEKAYRCNLIAEELEPASLIASSQRGWVLYFLRRYDEAVSHLESLIQVEPQFWRNYLNLGLCYIAMNRGCDAVRVLEVAAALNEYRALEAVRAAALGADGQREQSVRILQKMDCGGMYVSRFWLAYAWAVLGNTPKALGYLQTAIAEREWFSIFMQREPLVDPLRSDPSYAGLAASVGLT